MKKQVLKEFAELNGTSNQTDKPNSGEKTSEELIETRDIEGSPFKAVRMDQDWYLLLGKNRLNEQVHGSYEEVLKDAIDASWDRMIQVIAIITTELIKEDKIKGL